METNYPPIKESAELLLTNLPERLAAETHALLQRRDAFIASCGRVPPIENDEISGKVADLDEQIGKFVKGADVWKDEAKKPVLALDRAIMQQHKNLITTIVAVTAPELNHFVPALSNVDPCHLWIVVHWNKLTGHSMDSCLTLATGSANSRGCL